MRISLVRGALLTTLCATFLISMLAIGRADGPADNQVANVRRVPKLGVEVPPDVAAELKSGLKQLEDQIAELRKKGKTEFLPDVEIYHKAVHDALEYQEFFDAREFGDARELLKEGTERAAALLAGNTDYQQKAGLVVRGYRSRIDDSVQPYGLIVPQANLAGGRPVRLDIWLHGRGEVLSELSFLSQRRKQRGPIAPAGAIVLHPYGRYCNANKFAGEIDVLESMAAVQANYPVDEDRVVIRGFSMGGAGCWQMAVHYADLFAAATPGAGFSETPDFLKVFQKETLAPVSYEKTLWHWYDCTDWATNLLQCPTIAYSGELDSQKQAADIMEVACRKRGFELVHLIGPQTQHAIHPASAVEVERRLAAILAKGRDRVPRSIDFTTYSLRYNSQHWVQADRLGEHWKEARISADQHRTGRIQVTTSNVTAMTFKMPPGWCPFSPTSPVLVQIDGQELELTGPLSDRSWNVAVHRAGDAWKQGAAPEDTQLHKRHGLQGPIDDAFMDSFIFVKPSGKSKSSKVEAWVQSEMARAIEHWRRHFRGEARVKLDTEITPADVASANLVLWGDATSNTQIASLSGKLPIGWNDSEISVGGQTFSASDHAAILVYPNPESPRRYVVLNSSFTFRDYDYLNNARQTAKLPDWAIVDLNTAPDSRWPGKVVAADFFDDNWQVKKSP